MRKTPALEILRESLPSVMGDSDWDPSGKQRNGDSGIPLLKPQLAICAL